VFTQGDPRNQCGDNSLVGAVSITSTPRLRHNALHREFRSAVPRSDYATAPAAQGDQAQLRLTIPTRRTCGTPPHRQQLRSLARRRVAPGATKLVLEPLTAGRRKSLIATLAVMRRASQYTISRRTLDSIVCNPNRTYRQGRYIYTHYQQHRRGARRANSPSGPASDPRRAVTRGSPLLISVHTNPPCGRADRFSRRRILRPAASQLSGNLGWAASNQIRTRPSATSANPAAIGQL